MPCHHPLQAVFKEYLDSSGALKFKAFFPAYLQTAFRKGEKMPDGVESLPCGRCMGCRLERSRQWAVRIMHEAQLYEENCFLTLTFSEEKKQEMCPSGSLVKAHIQDFMQRLRDRDAYHRDKAGLPFRAIRYFSCGEYGEQLGRPHYHLCVFNYDFKDKKLWKVVNDHRYYTSDLLSELWPNGHSTIGAIDFESAAYVSRYCTKKVTGEKAEDHYGERIPEFCLMSTKPGIATGWLDKYGKTDVFPYDVCYVRSMKSKPPRFYDKYLKKTDPEAFEKIRLARREKAAERVDDNTYRRLLVKEKCLEAKFKLLIRRMEKS